VVCRLYNTAVFSDVTLLRLLSYNDFKTYFGSHKTLSISWWCSLAATTAYQPFYAQYTGQPVLAITPVKNWRMSKVLFPVCPCWWQLVHLS